MRGKTALLLFVLLLGGIACSKKQTESSQAAQTPAAETSSTQQASATPAQPAEHSTPQAQTAPATQSATRPPENETEKRGAAAVPTGTALVVQLNNAVSSKTAHAGETFTATVAKPVVVDGEALIPRGAAVTGIVTNVKAAGKLAGAAQMGLKLTSISVRGESYKVRSNEISQTSTGKGKRTAVLGGGGAGLGAIVGGLAGGKKGVLVGGLVGGGAGTAGSAFTGNADIALPAESVLRFRLSQPLDLSQPTLSSSK
jgi:glucose/arabinose dehydrogenase